MRNKDGVHPAQSVIWILKAFSKKKVGLDSLGQNISWCPKYPTCFQWNDCLPGEGVPEILLISAVFLLHLYMQWDILDIKRSFALSQETFFFFFWVIIKCRKKSVWITPLCSGTQLSLGPTGFNVPKHAFCT